MDILTVALLLIAAILGAVFLLTRNKKDLSGETDLLKTSFRNMAEPQMELDLDQKTRFVESPRRKKYRLLNDAEQELFHRLREAMPNMLVFAQVGVAQLAQLRGRRDARALARMAGRGVDFVICAQDFAIIAAIELAWPTSTEPEEEKNKALRSLGIPLIVFRPNNLPDAEAISREIADAIVRRNRLEAERR